MGYIALAAGVPNFNKAVFSFWFRIPSETFTALLAITDEPEDDSGVGDHWCNICYSPPIYKTIPLITFGSQEVATENSSAGAGADVSPSFIGIDFALSDPVLVVNLQMPNFADGDIVEVFIERPDCFFMGGGNGLTLGHQKTTVVADQWHHALISFDLSGSCTNTRVLVDDGPSTTDSISTGSSFTWALDDVPKVGESMFPSGNWQDYGASDASGIITQNVITPILGDEGSTATWSSASIASNANPIGIPASVEYVDSVYNIQMSEVQIFFDVTIDARVEGDRRAFVTSSGRPAPPSLAATLLGKSPEIYFQTHGDFINGINRGTAGDFTPTGTITAYTPGP